jgi:ADP-ribose pyrophosphatase YjhB (NUDIX family)
LTDRVGVVVNVCVVLHRDGRWLLTVRGATAAHAPGTIGVVGGHLEVATSATADEPALLEADVLENNARREVLEETGIDLGERALGYLGSEAFRSDAGHTIVAVTFVAELPSGAEPTLMAPDELSAVGWWSIPDLAADPRCPPWTLRLVRQAEQALVNR